MKKTFAILSVAALIFCAGSVIAYYNTASYGYDNANLITFRDDAVQILDFDISYETLKNDWEKVSELVPDSRVTISCADQEKISGVINI
ncbi:MAG: hypothetical protein IJ168_10210 [Eubacterium sp.]|nr:hypothetical protein [Eubacterium sp.]